MTARIRLHRASPGSPRLGHRPRCDRSCAAGAPCRRCRQRPNRRPLSSCALRSPGRASAPPRPPRQNSETRRSATRSSPVLNGQGTISGKLGRDQVRKSSLIQRIMETDPRPRFSPNIEPVRIPKSGMGTCVPHFHEVQAVRTCLSEKLARRAVERSRSKRSPSRALAERPDNVVLTKSVTASACSGWRAAM